MRNRAVSTILASVVVVIVSDSTRAESSSAAFKECSDCPDMVVLPAGQFLMGSPPSFAGKRLPNDEQPQHMVSIKSFAIGKYEVTQEQWLAVIGDSPSARKGPALPVERVSWGDIQSFFEKLNAKTGKHYRLPTEAEWEYAARAGTATQYSFGDDEFKMGDYAWFGGMTSNAGGKTHDVGQKLPNQFGLYDVHGNVMEWVQDCYVDNYDRAPADGSAVDGGACDSDRRVIRGGGWNNVPGSLRSASRRADPPGVRIDDRGFRVAITLP